MTKNVFFTPEQNLLEIQNYQTRKILQVTPVKWHGISLEVVGKFSLLESISLESSHRVYFKSETPRLIGTTTGRGDIKIRIGKK